jgi:hypothetical protein
MQELKLDYAGTETRPPPVRVDPVQFLLAVRGLLSGDRLSGQPDSGTDIAIDAAEIIILGQAFGLIRRAREISRYSYRKMVQNVVLAFCFNGIGIPLAATKLVYPVWAMVAMAVSITAIFFNSLWGRPSLFINAILSVGRMPIAPVPQQ